MGTRYLNTKFFKSKSLFWTRKLNLCVALAHIGMMYRHDVYYDIIGYFGGQFVFQFLKNQRIRIL